MPDAYFKDAAGFPHYDRRFFTGRVQAPARHRILLELLRDFQQIAAGLSVRPVLVHGSLLGQRLNDGRLFPWQDHVDLVVTYDELLRLARESGHFAGGLFALDVNPGHSDRTSRNSHFQQRLESNRLDARFLDRSTGLALDIAAAVNEGGRLVTKSPDRWPAASVYPLKPAVLEGVDVDVPNLPDQILSAEYGDLDRIRAENRDLDSIRRLSTRAVYPGEPVRGRGIVTTASDAFVPFLKSLLESLRRCGCRLPLEIWHRPGELRPEWKRGLSGGLVGVREFEAADPPATGWACKPAAILASSFAEVLFLDADNTVLADPAPLFEDGKYLGCGAVFWPDQFVQPRREAMLRRMLEISPDYTPVESGQMLLDKRRVRRGLQIVDDMNRKSDTVYRFVHGDKDTYTMGLEVAGQPYFIHRNRPYLRPDRSFVHFDSAGKPMFHHRRVESRSSPAHQAGATSEVFSAAGGPPVVFAAT